MHDYPRRTSHVGHGLKIAARAIDVAQNQHLRSTRTPRPKLTADTAVEYLDWALANQGTMVTGELERHIQAAELAIRVKMGEAQAKDTQHTLVRDGVLPPPESA